MIERSAQGSKRQQVEMTFSRLERGFESGRSLVTALVGLTTRIAAKICSYTYPFLVNRRL